MRAALVVLTVAVTTAAALAQTGEQKSSRKKRESAHTVLLTQQTPLTLLRYPAVRRELALTPKQEARWNEYQHEFDRQDTRIIDQFRELRMQASPEQRPILRQQRLEALDALNAKVNKGLLELLDARQRTRLDQIGIQREGTTAFLRPEFQERLNMSPGQIELVQEIVAEGQQGVRMALHASQAASKQATRNDTVEIDPKDAPALKSLRQKSMKAAYQALESAEAKILKLLSKKQRQVYESLKGEPFDLMSMKPALDEPKEASKAAQKGNGAGTTDKASSTPKKGSETGHN